MSLEDGKVVLRREDGTKTAPIPLDKLSEVDQQVARDLAAAMEPAPASEPADEEANIEAIRKLGAWVRRDAFGNVSVTITGQEITDEIFPTGQEITDEIFRALAGLQKLQRLSVAPGNRKGVYYEPVPGKPGVYERQHSSVPPSTRITGEGLAHLEPLPGLRSVRLYGMTLRKEDIASLGRLRNVTDLTLFSCALKDDDLASLKGLDKLTRLDLTNNTIGDAGLVHLKHLTGLDQLCLRNTKITDAGLAHLEPLTALRQLNLSGTRITDAGVVHFKPLKNLSSLVLEWTALSGSEAAQEILPRCKIEFSPISKEPIVVPVVPAEPFPDEVSAKLEALGIFVHRDSLEFNKESKGTVADLEGIAGIRFLQFRGCTVEDADLARLKNMPALTGLGFFDVPITDDDLIHFQDLKGSPLLGLHGTKVTEAAVKIFRAPFDFKAAFGLPAPLVDLKP